MSTQTFHNLSNSFRAVRLLALREFPKNADQGSGPFLVVQKGIDPDSLDVEPRLFVLCKHGAWIRVEALEPLTWEEGQQLALFQVAAEVIELLGRLPSKPVVEATPPPPAPTDPASPAQPTPSGNPPPDTGFREALLRAIQADALDHPAPPTSP